VDLAKLETYFQVYFGDVLNEVPVDFMEGETITHTQGLKNRSLEWWSSKTTTTQTIVIANPINLPITLKRRTCLWNWWLLSVGANNPN
jgi:hypothetical protein